MGTETGVHERPGTLRGRGSLLAFFGLTFALSWVVWLPKAAVAQGVETPLIATLAGLPQVGAFGPSVAAFILVFASQGFRGVRALLGRAVDLGFDKRWLLPAVLLPPLIVLGALAVAIARGATPEYPWAGQPIVLPVAFVFVLLLGGPLQEEFGWRGVAIDPLQRRFGALGGSLLLGIIWAVWHVPLFFTPSEDVYYNNPFIGFLVSITLLSVLLTWVYNNTNGSLLPVILMHAAWNWSNGMFPTIDSDAGGLALVVLLGLTTLAVVAYWGPARLTRAPARGPS
jgi:membrane protease YdiL (CAAX protease family)